MICLHFLLPDSGEVTFLICICDAHRLIKLYTDMYDFQFNVDSERQIFREVLSVVCHCLSRGDEHIENFSEDLLGIEPGIFSDRNICRKILVLV